MLVGKKKKKKNFEKRFRNLFHAIRIERFIFTLEKQNHYTVKLSLLRDHKLPALSICICTAELSLRV